MLPHTSLPLFRTLFLVLLLCPVFPALSQLTPIVKDVVAPPNSPESKKEAATKPSDNSLPDLKSVQEERAKLQTQITALKKNPTLYADQVKLLADIDLALSRQEEALAMRDYLEKEKSNILATSSSPLEAQVNEKFSKPYDLAKLDSLYLQKEALEEEEQLTLTTSVKADELLTQDLKAYEKSEEARRLTKDQSTDPTQVNLISTLQSRLDKEKLLTSRLNTANTNFKKENVGLKKIQLTPQIKYVQGNLQLNETAWRELKRQYDAKDLAIKESLQLATNRLGETQKELDKNQIDPSLASPAERARSETLSLQHLAAQRRASLNEAWKEQLRITREIMRHRFDLYQGKAKAADKKAWEQATQEALDRLEPQVDFLAAGLESSQKKLELLQSRAKESTDSNAKLWMATALVQQTEIILCYQEELWTAKALIRLGERFLAELDPGTKVLSLAEIREITATTLKNFWIKELFLLEDRPFRVSTLFWVLFWLATGFLTATIISHILGKKILLHYGCARGAAAAYQKLFYYGVIVVFCVGVFEYFNFSLTSLTIISGALALGFGFGSQDIIKNFISGLILLFERPINEGDLIEIENELVTVELIGARSTRVKAGDNTQRIVPNSHLLENIVVNWTLSDSIIRSTIEVGVAYGSPTREVVEIILNATQTTEGVLETPKCSVLFSNFGDNALLFQTHFSTAAVDRPEVCSEVRHHICSALQEAGFAMPFPQRDVHLDSSKPLDIRVIP